MKIEERALADVTVLDVEGRMTAESRERPLGALVRMLLQQGRKQILLNLIRVPHVDSTGLADIVEAYTAARRQGGSFKLEHLSPHVCELLRVTALLTVFEVFESEAEALASFRQATV